MKTNVFFRFAKVAVIALSVWSCGDPAVTDCPSGTFDGSTCVVIECPAGQVPEGDGCVSETPVDSTPPTTAAHPGAGTYAEQVTVSIASNEPSTIFYTTDGSTPSTSSTSGPSPVEVTLTQTGELKFFGVDAVGNEESVKTVAYTIDGSPPAQVSNFTASIDAGDVRIAWTNPADADFASTLVVRSVGTAVSGFTPAAEVTYDVGEFVAPNVQVAYRGTAQNVVDGEARAGMNHYAAFSRDTAGNYSTPATASVDAPFDNGQTATIEVRLADKQVVVTDQPRDVFIRPSGTFQEGTNGAEIVLDLDSRSGRVLTNLKLRVEDIVGATASGNATIESDAAVHYGLAVPIGGTANGKLTLTGVGPTDPIEITVGVYTDPVLVGPGNAGNSGGFKMIDPRSGTIVEMPCDVIGQSPTIPLRCAFVGLGRAPNSTTFYAGSRVQPQVVAFDPVANTTMVSAPLTASVIGSVVGIAVTPNGTHVLALLNDGTHWQQIGAGHSFNGGGTWSSSRVEIVRLKASDLTEVDRVTLRVNNTTPVFGRGISVDGGGTSVAAAVFGSGVRTAYRVSLANMQVNAQTTIPGSDVVNSVAISNDGSQVFIGYRTGTTAGVLSRWAPPAAPVNITLPNGGTDPRLGRMVFGPDGRLYLNMRQGSPSGVYAFDINTSMFSQISGQPARASALSPDGARLFTVDDQFPPTVRIIDVATTSIISATPLDTEFSLGRGHFCGEWIEP